MTTNEERNLAMAVSLCKAWNDHDADAFAGHFAEDGVWFLARGHQHPHAFEVKGKTAIREMYQNFVDTISDLNCNVIRHWSNTNNRACSEWHITGTFPDGEKLDWLGLDLWEFDEDGNVSRCDAYYKSEGRLVATS